MLRRIRRLFQPADPPAQLIDPLLGTLAFDADESLWEARVSSGGYTLVIRIAGKDAPDARLLAHARAVAGELQAFRALIARFLAAEAPTFKGAEDEVRSLQIESLNLPWPARPDDGMLYFEGGDPDRAWRCDYVDRKPVRLGFDS